MLRLKVQSPVMYSEERGFHQDFQERDLRFEHSLVSISKWESRWHKPYLSSQKTSEEVLDYVWCMCLDEVDPIAMTYLTSGQLQTITSYIASSMTATTFSSSQKSSNGRSEIITAEIVYWWMILYHIPFTCETWHLDRLLTLIRVASIRSSPTKKMTREEQRAWQIAENERRKRELKTKG